jgi:DNA-binding MarR family transcriptional regulator
MSELAEARFSSRSRLSHAVARLEANDWVRREACPTDKRGAWAVLTPAGFAALEAAAPSHVETVRESLFDPLTPEQIEQLGEIMAAVRKNMSPACAAAMAEFPPTPPC